jgi:chorismate mutase/prephenate dehydratase
VQAPRGRDPLDEAARADRRRGCRIHELLNDARDLARQVGISKHADGHTVDFYRPEREAQVLRMARERNKGPLRTEEILRLFREIMSACLAQEEPLKVGYLGPEGTFSQTATLKHFGHSVRALALFSVDEVFHEVEAGHADFGVVPVENSTEGAVNHTLDRCWARRSRSAARSSCAFTSPDGKHGSPRLDPAHLQPSAVAAQCRGWLDEHLPQVARVAVTSNAEGGAPCS